MRNLTLFQKFSLLCVISFVLFGAILGRVITVFLEENMLLRSKQITAEFVREEIKKELTMDDITVPKLGSSYDKFSKMVSHLNLGPSIKRVKIWNSDRTIVWSDIKRLVGQQFPGNSRLNEALLGKLISAISGLEEDEHQFEKKFKSLLELYVPIRSGAKIRAVIEIYQDLDPLYADISKQKRVIWISVVSGFAFLFLILLGIVGRASRRIEVQTKEISQSIKSIEPWCNQLKMALSLLTKAEK